MVGLAVATSCPECGSEDLSSIQEIRTKIIEDIPIIKKKTIRYRIARRYCRYCKKVVEISLKEALLKSRFSLRVMKLVTYMKAQLRIPIQLILKTLHVFFDLKVSEGEITNMISQMSKYYTPQYNDIRTGMREAPARNMDETSWREDGKNGYLWAFVTKDSAFFKIANTRRHDVPERILGRHKGVDIHDRYSGYNFLGKRNKQQLCWTHIMGDAKELAEFYGKEGENIYSIVSEVYNRANTFDHKGTDEDVAMNEKDKIIEIRLYYVDLDTPPQKTPEVEDMYWFGRSDNLERLGPIDKNHLIPALIERKILS